MLGVFGNLATYMFPGGRALKLIKNSVNITNSTNPLTLTKNITLTVLDCCAPPPVRLVAHCVGACVGAGAVKLLEEYHLIESKYKIISNGSLHQIQELTTRNISEGFLIYEKLSI